MKPTKSLLRLGLLSALALPAAAALLLTPATCQAEQQTKVVYHINDSRVASLALNNIRNHLNAAPGVKITVVTHGKGIDFLLKDAVDKNGNPYEVAVQRLNDQGVDFRVCNNTLKSRNLDKSAVIEEASVVPSGVAEVSRLQAREGYVYIKP